MSYCALAPGLGIRSAPVRLRFVALLGRNQALIEQALHAVVRSLGQTRPPPGRAASQARHLHFLGTGTVAGLGGHGLGRITGRLGLGQLGLHLGAVHFHQQIAGLDDLTLGHIHLGDARRDLGRDIGLTRLHLALENGAAGWAAARTPDDEDQHGGHGDQRRHRRPLGFRPWGQGLRQKGRFRCVHGASAVIWMSARAM
jgi:hypothetical protein